MKKNKVSEIVYHQHRSLNGEIHGMKHPINSKHKKESTIKAHNLTLKKG